MFQASARLDLRPHHDGSSDTSYQASQLEGVLRLVGGDNTFYLFWQINALLVP